MIRVLPILIVVFLLLLGQSGFTAPEPFALVRASYRSGLPDVRGGLMGTAFFISRRTAITAHHVLNSRSFTPLETHDRIQLWAADRSGHSVEIFAGHIKEFRELDVTVIEFDRDVVSNDNVFPLAESGEWDRASIQSIGYKAGSVQPSMKWSDGRLEFVSLNIQNFHRETGTVVREPSVTIKADDVVLSNIQCLNLSHGTYVGMSGGPTLANGKVVGVNSFGFPPDAERKTSAWAVYLKEEYRQRIFKKL